MNIQASKAVKLRYVQTKEFVSAVGTRHHPVKPQRAQSDHTENQTQKVRLLETSPGSNVQR